MTKLNIEELEVGDLVRNVFVPALIGVVTQVRDDGVIKVKIEGRPEVCDIFSCWEKISDGK